MSERVLVLGGGVSGLTTALCLREQGFEVSIAAQAIATHVTSRVAGALWEWPPAVCGHHKDERSLARSKQWCMSSYRVFQELAAQPGTGVHVRPLVYYFTQPVESCPRQWAKMQELKDHVSGFRHDSRLIEEGEVNPAYGVCDAYRHLSPMIDTDAYMDWLYQRVCAAGCRLHSHVLKGDLRQQASDLCRQYRAETIVNCTGLGARDLVAGDDMYPLRGALVRVWNDGRKFPRITSAHCVAAEEGDSTGFVFIVPRGESMLVLGGFAEPDEWDLQIGLDNYDPVRAIWDRCRSFLPCLESADIDVTEPVRVGLRPMRRDNVRVGRDPDCEYLIHNYGHGGSGVTLSWGCAHEVATLTTLVLNA